MICNGVCQIVCNLHESLFVCLFVLLYLTPLSTIFQLYRGGQKPEDPEKTDNLSQVTDNLYQIMLYTSPWSRFELTTSVVIDTDSIGSCKTNYHTITATMAPCMKENLFIVDSIHYIVYVLTKLTSIFFLHSKIVFQFLHESICTYRTPEHHTVFSQTV